MAREAFWGTRFQEFQLTLVGADVFMPGSGPFHCAPRGALDEEQQAGLASLLLQPQSHLSSTHTEFPDCPSTSPTPVSNPFPFSLSLQVWVSRQQTSGCLLNISAQFPGFACGKGSRLQPLGTAGVEEAS